MEISNFLETYKGEVKKVLLGSEGKSLEVGGEKTLPLHTFEGARCPGNICSGGM